ncbi:unnamed protein product [Lathyrus oleraceus]
MNKNAHGPKDTRPNVGSIKKVIAEPWGALSNNTGPHLRPESSASTQERMKSEVKRFQSETKNLPLQNGAWKWES